MSGKDAVTNNKSWRETLGVYFQYNMLLIFCLGMASGFPFVLTGSVLKVMLRQSGLDVASIGFFAWVSLPYTFKFIAAFFMDKFRFPWVKTHLAHRKSWCVVSQILLACALWGIAFTDPVKNTLLLGVFAVITATCSAMQDIMIDALRVEMVNKDSQGAAAAASVTGWRIGAKFIGAGGLLTLAVTMSWREIYILASFFVLLMVIVTLAIRNLHAFDEQEEQSQENNQRLSLFDECLSSHESLSKKFLEMIWLPLKEFLTRPHAIIILLFVALFKLGDAMAGGYTDVFYVDVGFSSDVIGKMQMFGLITTLAGAFVGGFIVKKLTINQALWFCGILQILSNFVFIWLVYSGADVRVLTCCVLVENFTGGMGTAAFVAFVAQLCNLRFTATQYALLTSISSIGHTFFSGFSGVLVACVGSAWFYAITAILGVPGMCMLYLLIEKEKEKDSPILTAVKD